MMTARAVVPRITFVEVMERLKKAGFKDVEIDEVFRKLMSNGCCDGM